MKNKGKLYSIALSSTILVFMFFILISAVASAAQVTRIGNGSDPAIYGSKVTWTDGGVINVYDLTTKTDTTVNSSAASYPAIYGNKLVWHDESSGTPRLTVYDINTAARSYITKDVDSYSIPAIYGSRIVWSANYNESNYNYNVYMRDISTSKQTKIADGNSPDIYNTKITYGYEDADGRTIAVYDINTKETINVHSSSQIFSPHIYGNKVIWSNFYSRDGFIEMYDLVTKKTINVTSDNTGNTLYGSDAVDAGDDTGTHIDINGDKIVYSKSGDDQFGYAGVYVYDIPSAKSTPVHIYPKGTYTTPDVYDNTIVWGIDNKYSGDVASDNGIYVSDLSATDTLPPVAAFTTNVTSGTAPLFVLFTDTGTGGTPISWYWDFGDGINSKHAQTATHTFTSPGTYNVTLTVTNTAGSNTVKKLNCITVTPLQAPVANFFSPQAEQMSDSGKSISINETVSFTDNSTGSPASWLWDFGDGATSTARNPEHVYTAMGGYTVTLTAANSVGNNTTSRYGYVLVGIMDEPVTPAYFSSDVTSGNAPLMVTFVDDLDAELPNYPIWREWNFGDGVVQTYVVDGNDSATPYATHVYEKPGKYTVTLYLDNRGGKSIITKSNYITVTDPEAQVADFSANVTSGAAPVVVLFTDTGTGEAPTSWLWEFGDGVNSKHAMNATHTFTTPGTYTISLTVENAAGNGTVTKPGYIVVTDPDVTSYSGGSSHSSSGSSSGGGGGSPEPAKNVEVKELSQVFITNGKEVKFDFSKNATCVVYVSFDAKRTLGKTTTVAEMLKEKSALVSELPSGEVYKSFNIWVGNGEVATSNNIENPAVCFKVEKDWMQDKKIDQSSISLNRYSENKWGQLPVSLLKEDDKYLYFTAETPEFSSFVITGEAKSTSGYSETGAKLESETRMVNKTDAGSKGLEAEQENDPKESASAPGFEIIYGIAGLLVVFLYRQR